MTQPAFSYRSDPAVPRFPDDRPILIFDGHCVLCSRLVQFILTHDRARRFRLVPAQAPIGQALYRHFGLDPTELETNILLEDGRAWFKAEGSIRVFEHLGLPWSLVAIGRVLPARWQRGIYETIAKNRLRWFGARDVCFLPDPAEADRFLG